MRYAVICNAMGLRCHDMKWDRDRLICNAMRFRSHDMQSGGSKVPEMSKWAWKPTDYAEMVMSEMQHTRCMSGMHTDDAIYTCGMTGCKIKITKVLHILYNAWAMMHA